MGLKVSQSGGDFEMVPEGQYVARCYKIIDLGTQTVEYKGQEKQQHKVIIYWEILEDDVQMDDGRPFSIGKQYTGSLSENSHLYKDLVSWRGKKFSPEELLEFDISNILGAYCRIQVIHEEKNGKTYANVDSIMGVGSGDKPKPVNDNVIFDIDNPDMEVFEGLTDWLKDKIRQAQEWDSTKEILSSKDDDKIEVKGKKLDIKVEDNDQGVRTTSL